MQFLRSKGEAEAKLEEFILFMENQTGERLKEIRSDRGGKFVSSADRSVLSPGDLAALSYTCLFPL